MKRPRRSEHIIAISNLFFLLRDLTLHFSIHVTVNWYNATMFKLKKSCGPKILYRRNNGDKKESKSLCDPCQASFLFRWTSSRNAGNADSVDSRKKTEFHIVVYLSFLSFSPSVVLRFHSAFYPQPAFYCQSAFCILHSVCILPLVRSPQSTVFV